MAAPIPPLLVWAAIIVGVWRLVRNPVRLWRIRHRGGHLVIAGDESLAAIVAGEGRSGNPAIVVTQGGTAGWRRRIHRTGSPHLTHDRLGAIGGSVRKARVVLIAGPDDEQNIAVARSIVAMHDRFIGRPVALPVIVRIDETRRHDAAEHALVSDADDGLVQVRLISLPALVARALLRGDLIDRVERIGSPERLLVIIGLTPISEHYLVDLLVSAHFADGRPVRVVVVDHAAEAQRAGIVARWPYLDRIGTPTFIDSDITDPAAVATSIGQIVASIGVPAMVLIDLGGGAEAIATLAAVDAVMSDLNVASPAYAIHAAPAALAGSPIAALAFGGADVAAYGELLLYEQQEVIARAIHDFYLEGRLDAGEALGSQPRIKRWEALTEGRRDDTRLLVDVYLLKLRDIGARIVSGRGAPLAFAPDDLSEMVRAQHERWLASRALEGWRWGETHDEEGRRHPEMVAAQDLPAGAVEREREHIRIITRLLARSGRRAVRDLRVLVTAGQAGDVAAAAAALAHDYPDRAIVFLGDPADPAVRAALHRLHTLGYPVQVCVKHHASDMADHLSADDAARCRDLLAHADRVIVCAPGDVPGAILADRADHRLGPTSHDRDGRPHPDRLAA
ncbi:hypothetical protein [uncultured Sphingomonas sp.]|uniref:hypothetical protein n=1 Tax=uncultured Sphingomonas sp. TaxID=158754 RepID=UPI0035CAC462